MILVSVYTLCLPNLSVKNLCCCGNEAAMSSYPYRICRLLTKFRHMLRSNTHTAFKKIQPSYAPMHSVCQKHQDVLVHLVAFLQYESQQAFLAIPTHNPLHSRGHVTLAEPL